LVVLPADSTGPIPIETKGITTVHRIFVAAIGHPQRATYTVTNLRAPRARASCRSNDDQPC